MPASTRSILIAGGGIAGLAAAYELHCQQKAGADITFMLLEQSSRLGGIVETHREDGFVLECGPDGWVTEKPWARELAEELGLADELIASRDDQRVTRVLQGGHLLAMPGNMRMMVPEDIDTIMGSPLFSEEARAAYVAEEQRAEELKSAAPAEDESVASFVERHFGAEVLRVIGAPLLGGVFGGDVEQLSVRAVMSPFVAMEREYGSLIVALRERKKLRGERPKPSIFTSLRSGTGALTEAMAASLPADTVRMQTAVTAVERIDSGWRVSTAKGEAMECDDLVLALPVDVTAKLLRPVDARVAELILQPTSSAVIAAFGYTAEAAPKIPAGFGFLSPEQEHCRLLAATFADQKYDDRVPAGGKSLRAFFGGTAAVELMAATDETIAREARRELERVLGPLPEAAVTVVRRWPNSLPQYGVGHGERMAELQGRVDTLGALHLLGNGYRGVGLPDLVRDARACARSLVNR